MSKFSLVVRNIGWSCIKEDVTSYFKKFGLVHRVNIPINYQTGFNRNVAFVTLTCHTKSLDSILKDYHIILGNEVTVEMKIKDNKQQQQAAQ